MGKKMEAERETGITWACMEFRDLQINSCVLGRFVVFGCQEHYNKGTPLLLFTIFQYCRNLT